MYAEVNVTSGTVHVIRQVRIKLASTWKILRLLLLVIALPRAANENPAHEIERPPAKRSVEATRIKAQVRRALNRSTKQSVSAALEKAISSPSSLDSGELLPSVLQEVDRVNCTSTLFLAGLKD